MGQKSNPIGLRLGIIKGWDSNWFGGKDFSDKIVEDTNLRKYLKARLPKGSISKIVIDVFSTAFAQRLHTVSNYFWKLRLFFNPSSQNRHY